jgi:hypothetical protein
MSKCGTVVGAVWGVLFAFTAESAVIRYDFSGTLTSVDAPLTSNFAVGQPFTLSYTFDTNATPTAGSVTPGPGFADYAASGWKAETTTFLVSAPAGTIRVTNNSPGDEYLARPAAPVTTSRVPTGFRFSDVDLAYRDASGAAFGSTALPGSSSSLEALANRLFTLTFIEDATSTPKRVVGSVGTLVAAPVPVPEPGILPLLSLAAIGMLRRRRT